MLQLSPTPLWIGHAGDAREPRRLAEFGIAAVVDVGYQEPPAVLPRQMIYCRIPLVDGGGNDPAAIRLAIRTVADLLSARVPTLVACSAGLSRSPVIAAAALAQHRREPIEKTLADIAALRPLDVSGALWAEVKAMLNEEAEAIAGIRAGLADVAAGRVRPAEEVFEDLKRQLGLKE